MSTGQTLVQSFADYISSNIDSLNIETTSYSKKWVFTDIGKLDTRVYPRVNVLNPTSNSIPLCLHSDNQKFSPRIDIQIRVKKGMVLKVATVDKTDMQILDILSKSITDGLRTTSFRTNILGNNSVFYSVLEAENTIYGDYVVIRQLIYKNVLVR